MDNINFENFDDDIIKISEEEIYKEEIYKDEINIKENISKENISKENCIIKNEVNLNNENINNEYFNENINNETINKEYNETYEQNDTDLSTKNKNESIINEHQDYNEIDNFSDISQPITEKYLSNFIGKDILFIGEFINIQDKLITLKSVSGNKINCLLKKGDFNTTKKYIGIQGMVTEDLQIVETRGVLHIDDVDTEMLNNYIDICMEHMNSYVFVK